jgi:hypothetical protein
MCVYGHPTHPIFQLPTLTFFISNYSTLIFANDPINFYTESKKSRVGINIFLIFLTIGKTGNSRIRFRYAIFEISGKPSFVL